MVAHQGSPESVGCLTREKMDTDGSCYDTRVMKELRVLLVDPRFAESK